MDPLERHASRTRRLFLFTGVAMMCTAGVTLVLWGMIMYHQGDVADLTGGSGDTPLSEWLIGFAALLVLVAGIVVTENCGRLGRRARRRSRAS